MIPDLKDLLLSQKTQLVGLAEKTPLMSTIPSTCKQPLHEGGNVGRADKQDLIQSPTSKLSRLVNSSVATEWLNLHEIHVWKLWASVKHFDQTDLDRLNDLLKKHGRDFKW